MARLAQDEALPPPLRSRMYAELAGYVAPRIIESIAALDEQPLAPGALSARTVQRPAAFELAAVEDFLKAVSTARSCSSRALRDNLATHVGQA